MAFISVHCSECVRHVEANVLVLCRCALQTEHGSLPAKSFLSHLYVVHYGPRELFPLCFSLIRSLLSSYAHDTDRKFDEIAECIGYVLRSLLPVDCGGGVQT